jgi:hypothetical protein
MLREEEVRETWITGNGERITENQLDETQFKGRYFNKIKGKDYLEFLKLKLGGMG